MRRALGRNLKRKRGRGRTRLILFVKFRLARLSGFCRSTARSQCVFEPESSGSIGNPQRITKRCAALNAATYCHKFLFVLRLIDPGDATRVASPFDSSTASERKCPNAGCRGYIENAIDIKGPVDISEPMPIRAVVQTAMRGDWALHSPKSWRLPTTSERECQSRNRRGLTLNRAASLRM